MKMPRASNRVLAVSWRAPLAAIGSLGVAITLAVLALGFGGDAAETINNDTTTSAAITLSLLPTIGLVVATLIGMTCGVSVVAVLVRDALAGHRPRLIPAWWRAWVTLPKLAVLLVGVAATLAVAVLAWAPICAGFIARALWRLRSTTTRPTAKNGLWLAVPCAPAVALIAAVPAIWSALLSGTALRKAIRDEVAAPLTTRLRVLAGLIALAATSYGLGLAGLELSSNTASTDPSTFANGTVGIGALSGALIIIAGILLGALSHTRGDAATPERVALTGPAKAPTGFRAGRFWRPARVAMTATLLSATVMMPTVMTGLSFTSAAAAAAPAPENDFTVDTLADDTTINSDDCVTEEAPCGIRAALAAAEPLTQAGNAVTVTFALSGTVSLADTLDIPAGVIINAPGHDVTLDAHHAFRALRAYTYSEGSTPVVVQDITVTGGRSTAGGAGLFSDNVPVTLDRVEFEDNISDSGDPNAQADGPDQPYVQRDGGAVATPYAKLTVNDSLFVDNHARSGVGGAVTASTLYWTNSTATNNTGVAGRPEGGALFATFGGHVNHATITAGGGVSGSEDRNLAVSNSAVTTVSASFPCARITDPSDEYEPSAGNVDPTGTCLGTRTEPAPLGPLADNGGPTRTIALLPGSPAIGAAHDALCAPTDQRGNTRNPSSCDAGAFQSGVADIPQVNLSITAPATTSVNATPSITVKLASEAAIPAGTVTVRLDGVVLGSDLKPDTYHEVHTETSPLTQGPHQITAEFIPADGTPTHTSPPRKIVAQAPTTLSITAEGPTTVGSPALLHATLSSPDSEPGTPDFTGDVTFTSGATTYTVALDPGGVATWIPDALPAAHVEATWDGDDHHTSAFGSAVVTTSNIPTTTTHTLTPTTVTYGDPITVTGYVTDPLGAQVTGRAVLLIDGVPHGSRPYEADGTATFTPTLDAGTHQVAVRTDPDSGWEPSASVPTTVTVEAADAHVTLNLDPDTITWPKATTAYVTAAGLGEVVVELTDGDTLLGTRDVTLNGLNNPVELTFALDPYTLNAGAHQLRATVVASDTTTGAQATQTLTVAPAPTTLGLRAATRFPRVGSVVEISSSLEGGWAPQGTLVLTDEDGTELTRTAALGGTLSWVAKRGGSQLLTATYHASPGGNHLSTSAQIWVNVEQTHSPTPTLTWSEPAASGTTLTVTYPDADPEVTGRVNIEETNLGIVGSAELADGQAVITLYAPAGTCYCGGRLKMTYSGSHAYLPTSTWTADVNIPAHPTVTTLGPLPETVPFNGELYLSATVAPTTGPTPTGRVVFAVNGTDVANVELTAGGTPRATYQVREPVAADQLYMARNQVAATSNLFPSNIFTAFAPTPVVRSLLVTARYVPGHHQWDASASATTAVGVTAVPTPTVTLALDDTRLAIGKTSTLTATAGAYGWVIADGTEISVHDSHGNTIGSGTFTGPDHARRAAITFTPVRGGPQKLAATYTYGPDRERGQTAPIDVTVTGVPSVVKIDNPNPNPPVGFFTYLDVTHDLSATPHLRTAGVTLFLLEDGLLIDEVTLSPDHTWHRFAVRVETRHGNTYTVYTQGDGHNYVSGGAQTTVVAEGIETRVDADDSRVITGHTATINVDLRATGYYSLGDPTGFLYATVLDAEGRQVHTCALTLPATKCTFGTASLDEGTYTVDVEYSGDDIHYPAKAKAAAEIIITTERSTLRDLSFSPRPHAWLVGQQVTATWRARDPQTTTPTGSVSVAQTGYGQLCAADAATQTCSFVVPTSRLPLAKQPQTELMATYTPQTTSLLSKDYAGLSQPAPRCLTVTARTPRTYDPAVVNQPAPSLTGRTCTVAGVSGYVEGTWVNAHAEGVLPKGYKIVTWHVEANHRGDITKAYDSPTHGFEVLHDSVVYPSIAWDPDCVTLTTTNELYEPRSLTERDPKNYYHPGHLEILTTPNCSSPYGASVYEKLELEKGRGHFATGTVVEVEPFTYRRYVTSVKYPEYTAYGVPYTNAPTAEYPHPHLKLVASTLRYGKFRLSSQMCTPTRFYAGIGGTIKVLRSKKPDAVSYTFEDPQGRCLTAGGERGYLAGTNVTTEAVPQNSRHGTPYTTRDKEYFVSRWLDPIDLNTKWKMTNALLAEARTTTPAAYDQYGWNTPYKVQHRDVTVPVTPWQRYPEAPGALTQNYGVQFASIVCTKVAVSMTYPVSSRDDPTTSSMQMTPSNCPAEGGHPLWRGNPEPDIGEPQFPRPGEVTQLVRTDAYVTWYKPGTDVTITGAETATGHRGKRNLMWSAKNNRSSASPIVTRGAVATLTADLGQDWQVKGTYAPEGCRTPNVKIYPAWIDRTYEVHGQGACPEGQSDTNKMTHLYASGYEPNIRSVWQINSSQDDVPAQAGRIYGQRVPVVREWGVSYMDHPSRYNAQPKLVELHYCSRLPVGVKFVDHNGKPLSYVYSDHGGRWEFPSADDILTDGSRCPAPLYAHPGTTAQVGVSGKLSDKWTVAGYERGGVTVSGTPTASTDVKGAPVQGVTAVVTPRCLKLDAATKVHVATAVTCPGTTQDQRMFLAGTPVTLKFSGNGSSFKGWSGVDAHEGEYAVVIMNRDRSVSAGYHTPSGLELAVNVLTNIEQRLISALITAATGVAMGFLFVAQVAALAVVGIATALEAVGVSGEGIDRMRAGAETVQSGLDVVQSVADCTTSWATGGAAPPLSPSTYQGGQGVAVGTGVAEELADLSESTTAADSLGTVTTVLDVTNLLLAGPEVYLRDAGESWSQIVDIGGCIADTGRAAGAAGSNMVR